MKKTFLAITITTALILAVTGCSSGTGASASPSASASSSESASASPTASSGITVSVTGADYVATLIDELGQTYMTNNPDVTVGTASDGSNVGIAKCADGTADIALSSRYLEDIEKSTFTGMTEKVLCVDGIVIVVGKDSAVTNLTADQVKNIFVGLITDWSEAGGTAGTINAYTMDSSSEIRTVFNSLFLGTSAAGKQIDTDDSITTAESTEADMVTALEGDSSGIGYLPLTALTGDQLKALSIGGVSPTSETITNGSYQYLLRFILMTRNPKAEASAFLNYCTGSDAAQVIKGKGYVIP
jgi:phosphate transport system substrate-binding protein